MPIKAGLDFGTTTSILSYLDGAEQKLTAFHYGGHSEDGTPYVPSVVAYMPKDLFIGQRAISMLADRATLYRYFKMLLPVEQSEQWPDSYGPYAAGGLSPAQVASDFIGELVSGASPGRERLHPREPAQYSFRRAHGGVIEELVVSVPQVWSDVRAYGRQQLQTVVRELGLPLKQLISEPVAAAAYFTYCYRMKQGEPYSGNLLVCDMGGGTFDVALCRLRPGHVEVLCNEGNGERGLGIAGAHFDHALIEGKLGTPPPPEVLSELLVALDEQKKKSAVGNNRLTTCIQVAPEDRPVAPIYAISSLSAGDRLSFSFDDVSAAFEPVRVGIFEVLGKVRREAERRGHRIDRVVLVGGFSKFPLVQHAVGQFFDEDVFGSRKLIDLDTFSREDMAYAISYGACLVANDLVEVSEKYEHTVGIIVTNASGQDEEVVLINAGKSLDALAQITYCEWYDGRRRRFRITRDTVEAEIFIRLSGSGAAQDNLVRTLALRGVPNSHVQGNRWFLGTYVDRSKIPYLVVEDERHGLKECYPLGDLIPDIIMEGA